MSQPALNQLAIGPRRAGFYAALALVAAALLGAAAGFAAGRARASSPRGPDVSLLGVSRATLLDSLGLSAEQRSRVESVLTDAAQRANVAIDGMMTEVRSATDDARREVRALLDERQRSRFDSILSAARPVLPRSPLPNRSRGP